MFSKKICLILLSGFIAFSLLGCSDDGDSGNNAATGSMTQSEAQVISTKAMTAIASAMTTVNSKSTRAIVDTPIDITNETWSASGTISSDDTTTYPITTDITFIWNEFVYEDVTLSSGTAQFVSTMSSASEITYKYTGTFVILYQGISYNYAWDIDGSMNGQSITYTGTFTVDGVTYTWVN